MQISWPWDPQLWTRAEFLIFVRDSGQESEPKLKNLQHKVDLYGTDTPEVLQVIICGETHEQYFLQSLYRL